MKTRIAEAIIDARKAFLAHEAPDTRPGQFNIQRVITEDGPMWRAEFRSMPHTWSDCYTTWASEIDSVSIFDATDLSEIEARILTYWNTEWDVRQ